MRSSPNPSPSSILILILILLLVLVLVLVLVKTFNCGRLRMSLGVKEMTKIKTKIKTKIVLGGVILFLLGSLSGFRRDQIDQLPHVSEGADQGGTE